MSTLTAAHADPKSESVQLLESITAAAPHLVANVALDAPVASSGITGREARVVKESKNAKIGLPQAKSTPTREIPLTENIQATDYGNDSVIVPLRQQDGSLAVLSVAKSAKAPTSISYELDVPAGGTATLTKNQTVLVYGADGSFHSLVSRGVSL